MSDSYDQDIGFIKATMEHQSKIIEELRNDMKEMKQNWAEVRGGWRVVLVVAAFVGAGVTHAINWVMKHA
jgi:archaellum component FlaC